MELIKCDDLPRRFYELYDSRINDFIRDCPPTGFHNLSVNTLVTIFMYLDVDELRTKVMRICHKWRQVALLPIFWRALKFQGLNISQNYICQQLQSLSHLQCVYLVNIPNAAPIIRQLCRCNTRIIKVAIKNCKNKVEGTTFPEKALRNLVASCRKLQEINLKGTPISGNVFYIEVAVLPELRSINLSNNRFLKKKNIYELILNSHLEELKLSQSYMKLILTDYDISIIFNRLKETLRSISIDTLHLSDNSFEKLFSCNKLRRLYLYNARSLSPMTFIKLKYLDELERLKIHNCRIPSTYFVLLFAPNYYTFLSMRSIDFSGASKLTTTGLEAMCKCCKDLEIIGLKSCKDLENISCLWRNCKKLSCVNIAFCPKLSNENILQVPVELPKLDSYYIDDTRKLLLKKQDVQLYRKLSIFICLSEYNKEVEPL